MKAPVLYGGVLAVLIFVCRDLIPHPYGLLFLFGLNAILLLRTGVLVLTRLRLPYAASSMFLGGVGFLSAMAFTLAGFTLDTLPTPAKIAYVVLGMAGVLVLHAEIWASPERWKAWGDHMQDSTLLDVFLGNHIPELQEIPENQHPTPASV